MTTPADDHLDVDSVTAADRLAVNAVVRTAASDYWDVVIVTTELSSPVELVGRDPLRLRAQIVNTGGNLVVINSSREALTAPKPGFTLTPGGSIALDTTAPIWAISVASPAGGGPSEVTLLIEGRRARA